MPLLTLTGFIGVELARSAHHHLAGRAVVAGTLLAIGYVVFRPLAAPRGLPGPDARAAAAELVHRYGTDTLSFFKLRGDKQYFFSQDRRAFVGYRIENGVLLLSGDPVGPESHLPGHCSQSFRRSPKSEVCGSVRSAPASACARSTSGSGCARSTSAMKRSWT